MNRDDLREKEIERLTSVDDVLEPKKGILSDDEILFYAGDSVEASRIRLKRGEGDLGDKFKVHDDFLAVVILVFLPGFILALFSFWIWVIIAVIVCGIFLYMLFVQGYTEPEFNQIESNNDDLLVLFENKEMIAREMIEKKFPSPQMTNSKFNGVLDNCKKVVESQVEILNALTLTEKTKYEIESRKDLIKQVISKVDDLTNELILSEKGSIDNSIMELDELIESVKDYD